jgi:hypothetical protein
VDCKQTCGVSVSCSSSSCLEVSVRSVEAAACYCTVYHECLSRVSVTSVYHECLSRVSLTNVYHECLFRVSPTSVYHECLSRVCLTSVRHGCPVAVAVAGPPWEVASADLSQSFALVVAEGLGYLMDAWEFTPRVTPAAAGVVDVPSVWSLLYASRCHVDCCEERILSRTPYPTSLRAFVCCAPSQTCCSACCV